LAKSTRFPDFDVKSVAGTARIGAVKEETNEPLERAIGRRSTRRFWEKEF
jgi:hypothetical protein